MRVLRIVAGVLMLLLCLLFFVATFGRDMASYYMMFHNHELSDTIDEAWWFDICGPAAAFSFEIIGLWLLTYTTRPSQFAKAVEQSHA